MSRRHPGFTIIELALVIVVIGILSTIVIVSYQGVQVRARDAKLIDAADKVKDAIQLFAVNSKHFPRGGYGASTAIGASTECTNGAAGFFATAVYTCTVEDTLVGSGYLPKGFSAGLPTNKLYSPPGGNGSLMVYNPYVAGAKKVMVFYYMEQPSAEDTSNFNAELTECGYVVANTIDPRDSWGMRNGICADY